MARHEAWRLQYRRNRYARLLSQQELNQRIRDLILSGLRLNDEAKIGPPPLPPASNDGAEFMEKWTHMLEEMTLRHGPYPAGFTREILHSEPIPDLASELGERAANALKGKGLSLGDTFIKYGKRQFMEMLYEEGALRIQPASYFMGIHHNSAIRDDELSIPISLALTRDDVVKVVKNPHEVPDILGDQRFDANLEFPTDYWLYCLSNAAEARLFVDFDADACVIIRDRSAFSSMLEEAARPHFPGSVMQQGSAEYVDPLLPKTGLINIPFAKHFRYSYQYEYRFCWIPSERTNRVQHVDLKLGSLKDIADIVFIK